MTFNSDLSESIKQLAPWHHDIELSESISTGKVFHSSGTLPADDNDGVSLISPRRFFTRRVRSLFGGVSDRDMLSGKSFLDCACNAGAYCFLAREFGASRSVGFDVREHWINQAKFVQQHRTYANTDNIEFFVSDLYDIPGRKLPSFDLTYFSGIFYHLPDPISGLKIAADLTRDVIVVNTACAPESENPLAMSLAMESATMLMSGVHELAWLPNSPEILFVILRWMGFEEAKLVFTNTMPNNRRRIEVIAARELGRLDNVEGIPLST